MITSAIRVLSALQEEQMAVRNLARVIGLSYRRTAEIVNGLIQQGLLEKGNEKVGLAQTALATFYKKVSKRYDMAKLLGASREEVLIALLNPGRIDDVQPSTEMTYYTIRRALVMLMEIGGVRGGDGVYSIADDQELRTFLTLLKDERLRRYVEPYAEVVYASADTILKRVPEGKSAKGSMTAFSVFGRYGVELHPVYSYYVQPEREMGVEEILVHAIVFSETPAERTDCAVFLAKNRDSIDLRRLRELARRFGVLDLAMGLENYVVNIHIPSQEKFLPWEEFAEKARLYGLPDESLMPPLAFPAFMEELSRRVEGEVSLYVFGGEAMRIRGLKRSTKDIDVVVEDTKTYDAVKSALASMEYRALSGKEITIADSRIQPSGIFVSEGLPRVDIFVLKICNAFRLSSSMKSRCETREVGRIKLCIMSDEDIFLLKSVTGRAGDLQDMVLLAKSKGFNWRAVLYELYSQERETGRHFCMSLLESIEAIERSAGIKAPFYGKLVNHCIGYGILESVKHLKVATVKQIMEFVDYPEYRIRSRVRKLVMEKSLMDLGDGRYFLNPAEK
jgi:hypothetical protein